MTEYQNLTCGELDSDRLAILLAPYQIKVITIDNDKELPGSFWGDPEAGLINNQLYVKPYTPLQSALHEACHYICMDTSRRENLDTNAGGDYNEENAVCYLQILLAAKLKGCSAAMLMENMDSWGYSFRLGSTRAWFENDAEDAQQWLIQEQLIKPNPGKRRDTKWELTWQLRL